MPVLLVNCLPITFGHLPSSSAALLLPFCPARCTDCTYSRAYTPAHTFCNHHRSILRVIKYSLACFLRAISSTPKKLSPPDCGCLVKPCPCILPCSRAALTPSAAFELPPPFLRDLVSRERGKDREKDRDRDRSGRDRDASERERERERERDRSDRGSEKELSSSRHERSERERSRSRERKREERRSSRERGGGSRRDGEDAAAALTREGSGGGYGVKGPLKGSSGKGSSKRSRSPSSPPDAKSKSSKSDKKSRK